MNRKGWHILRDGDRLTLTRRLPVRFDVQAETVLRDGSRARMAQQIRQDLWRQLQNLRGFSPVVELTRKDGQLHVRAGGRVDGAVAPGLEARIAALLSHPKARARWQAYAAHQKAEA